MDLNLFDKDFTNSTEYFQPPHRQYAYNEYVRALRSTMSQQTLEGIDCMSSCASAGQELIHPLTSKPITNLKHTFCAINPTLDNNAKMSLTGKCFMPNYSVIHNRFVPLRSKDCKLLLGKYTPINDWGTALQWAHLSSEPELLKRQVLNCASRVYNNISTDRKKKYEERQYEYYLNLAHKKLITWYPGYQVVINIGDIKKILMEYVQLYKLDWLSLHLDSVEILRRIRIYVAKYIIGT